MADINVRTATATERERICKLLDRAMLAYDREAVLGRIHRDAVLVAEQDDTIHGAALLAGDHVEAIAVDRSRRGEGIGRALIDAVQDRTNRVTVACHAQAAEFYRSLDFTLYALPGGRVFGYRHGDQTSGSMSS